MVQKDVEILGHFHDGSISIIRGQLPTLQLYIDIEYLRAMFSPPGQYIILQVQDCTQFEYRDWISDTVTDSLQDIERQEFEILNAQRIEEQLCIIGSEGELRLTCGQITLSLDSGDPITHTQLKEASQTYWRTWEKNTSAQPSRSEHV